MKFLSLVTSLLVLFACNSTESQFPNVIDVKSTAGLKRITGTKLYVSAPENYKYYKNRVRFERDGNTYMQVMEVPGSNIMDIKEKLTEENIKKQGAKVDELRHIIFNGYEAIYQSGPSKIPGETKLGITFGDKSFAVMVMGSYKTSDKGAKEELLKIMKTSYYEKSFELDPMELVTYEFDPGILNFKLAQSMGSMLIYTANGKEDLNTGKDMAMMQITTMESPSFEKSKEFLDYTIARYSKHGEVSNEVKETFVVDGKEVYAVSLELKTTEGSTRMFQAVMYNGRMALILSGLDNNEPGLMEKFRKTVHSIKF